MNISIAQAKIPLLCSLLIAAQRLWWGGLPLERDVSTYAVIARGLLEGRALYADLWDHKPPLIHLMYALGALVFGSNQFGITLLGIALAIASLWLVVAILRELKLSERAVLSGALCFSLLQGDLFLEAYLPNTEAGIMLCIFAALLFALRYRRTETTQQLLGLVAATIAASFFKQIAVLPILGALPWLLTRAQLWRVCVMLGVAGSLCWGAFLWFTPGAYAAVIEYNRFYAGSISDNLTALFELRHLFPRALLFAVPALALALASIPANRWIAGVLGGGLLTVALPGQFYNHYYQLLFPAITLGFALSAATASRRWLHPVTLLVMGLYQLLFIVQFPGDSFSHRRHGEIFASSRDLGARLAAAKVDFALVGNSTGVLFTAGKAPGSGVVYTAPLSGGPQAAELQQRLMEDLNSTAPAVIVTDRDDPFLAQFTPFQELLQRSYRRCDPFGALLIYSRTDANCPRY